MNTSTALVCYLAVALLVHTFVQTVSIELPLTFDMSKHISAISRLRIVQSNIHTQNIEPKTMASLIPRFLLISKSVHNFNGLHNIQSYTKCIRQMHLVHTRQFSIVSSQLLALASAKHSPIASSPFNYNSLRFKHNKRGGKHRHSDDESGDDDDDNDDDDSSNLNDFKEGNSSDRNLARVKTKSLRLDAVINAGLGISKK